MDKIIDHLFVFKGLGNIDNFPGNYSDYRTYEDSKIKDKSKRLNSENHEIKENKKNYNKSSLNYSQQKEFKKLEREIKKTEALKEEIQNHFNNELSLEEVKKYSVQLKNIEQDLELKTNRWFELSEN